MERGTKGQRDKGTKGQRIKMAPNYSKWFQMTMAEANGYGNGPTWFINGPQWSQLVQNYPQLSNIVQNGQIGFQIVQMVLMGKKCPKLSKIFQYGLKLS